MHPVLKGSNIEQHVDNHEPEVNSGGDAVSSVAQKGTGEGEGKKEDRSAILAQFLAQQVCSCFSLFMKWWEETIDLGVFLCLLK